MRQQMCGGQNNAPSFKKKSLIFLNTQNLGICNVIWQKECCKSN